MHQPVNGLAGSRIKTNSARPGKAKQKEEPARSNKCQDEVYRLAGEIIDRLRSLSMQQHRHNKKPGHLARLKIAATMT